MEQANALGTDGLSAIIVFMLIAAVFLAGWLRCEKALAVERWKHLQTRTKLCDALWEKWELESKSEALERKSEAQEILNDEQVDAYFELMVDNAKLRGELEEYEQRAARYILDRHELSFRENQVAELSEEEELYGFTS